MGYDESAFRFDEGDGPDGRQYARRGVVILSEALVEFLVVLFVGFSDCKNPSDVYEITNCSKLPF